MHCVMGNDAFSSPSVYCCLFPPPKGFSSVCLPGALCCESGDGMQEMTHVWDHDSGRPCITVRGIELESWERKRQVLSLMLLLRSGLGHKTLLTNFLFYFCLTPRCFLWHVPSPPTGLSCLLCFGCFCSVVPPRGLEQCQWLIGA